MSYSTKKSRGPQDTDKEETRVFHAITAAFHEVRDKYRKHHKAGRDEHAIATHHQQMRHSDGVHHGPTVANGHQQTHMGYSNGRHGTARV